MSAVIRWCLLLLLALPAAGASAQTAADLLYTPYVGQPGKDVIWVPTPPGLVEKMLDMAKVTPQDFVIDLGSGDGRNIIAAAKRGARGLGVEWDTDLVRLSQQTAAAAGVAHLARFVRGDMYEADISQATVLALFLLPANLERLRPKFEKLRPGTRIVTNGYAIPGWKANEVRTAEADCGNWCEAYLYVLPAQH
ncbi:MAG TPA: class I SAM-dependent methyltransferase [Burkholderiales bacterium]|nr:class I SAM-dependent methyltransferase [Burkholderiales bacterium]